jgi:hypothetical protein
MKRLRLVLAIGLLLALAACGAPTAGAPTPEPPARPTRTPRPTPRPTQVPAPTAPPTAIPVAALTAELAATAAAALPPTATAAPGESPGFFAGIEGVDTQPLEAPGGSPPLWAVSSRGMRAYEPPQSHFVAIYTREGGAWRELARAELERYDFFEERGLTQVEIDPRYVWLEAQGGAGAHSGCYDLLRFDGETLHSEVSTCSSSPGAGELIDLDGDRTPEAVLDATNYYVFCYACGVRLVGYQALRWDGERMAEIRLKRLPASAPPELRELNNRAIDLAEHGLWKDARAAANQAEALGIPDEDAAWNTALIRLIAGGREEQAESAIYPLLDHLYFGDYAAALEPMRAHAPADLWSAETPLVRETVAAGWEIELAREITSTATLALELDPNLAAAYFLRGWALHLADPSDPSALTDVERAAALAPEERLFSDSLAYLTAGA